LSRHPENVRKSPETAPRRSQAERRADSRARLVEAAVTCLNAVGYAETSLRTIAEQAGLSLGAIHNQFPTKVDLMLAVVSDVSAGAGEPLSSDACLKVHRALEPLSSITPDQFVSLWDALWMMHTRPPAMAKLEIMMAAHSDPVLAAQLKPILSSVSQARRDYFWAMAKKLGVSDRSDIDLLTDFGLTTMRGLAVEQLATGDISGVARQFGELRRHIKRSVENLQQKDTTAAITSGIGRRTRERV
jgi:AcrR family transcriptional regulator